MAEQLLGIRKYLQDQGYGENDIGYNNGNVTLKGQNLISATPQAQTDLNQGLYKDSTYASGGALKNALAGYQNTYGAPKLDNTNKLNNLNNNLYNTATTKPFEFKQQQSPFSYDPNSDQAYQAALRSAQSNIQTGQNNTLANLLAHGQGNSSYAASAAQQIANKEMGNVSNNILPQLIQQAYQRYQDQNNNDYRTQAANYGVGQDQFKNQSALSSYFNGLGQQDFNNNLATNQDNRAQAGLTGYINPGEQETNAVKQAMERNSAAWANADTTEQQRLHGENLKLAASIGGTDTSGNGDYAFGPMRTVQGQQMDTNNTQQQWDNEFKNKAFDYQKAADLWERTFKDKTFEQSVKQAAQGLGVDYSRMSQSQQQFAAEMAYKYKALEQSANKPQTGNFNVDDYKGYINQNFYKETPDPNNYGKPVKSFDSSGARKYIIGLGLPDDQTDQLLKLNNLPTN